MRACGSTAEQLRCLSCSIFVRIQESVVRSAMSSPCWSLPHLSSSPHHEAPPGQHDLLQDDTVHREPLSKTTWSKTPKNPSRTSIMRVADACAQTLPQVVCPRSLRPKSLRQFRRCLQKQTFINYTMYRENLENKINKLQLKK